MFYVNQDDDDSEFSVAAGGSKLANLFSSDQTNLEKQSPSLTYTAPKQPKKTDGQTSGVGLTALHAVAVHAYKFENQQYTSQGKVGAAIIGSHETSVYKILLYKGKQQQIAIASVSPNFSLKIQANNYANFYDDKREIWSIMFDSEQNLIEFSKQVALAKANCAGGKSSSVVIQELTPGDGQEVAIGDAIEIKFTGWLLTNYTYGQEFDSNATSETFLRMKLGKSKFIKGWEDGLIGSKKSSRRILIIPPSLAYGAQGIPDKVPPNSTLIFDICVNKVKFANSRDRSRSSTPSTLDSDNSDGKRVDQSHSGSRGEESVRSRGASLSEQMSHSPKSDKAKIISRMAKMGMPMLPMHGAVPAQPSSESDFEEEGQQSKTPPSLPPRTSSPKLPPKPRTASFNHPTVSIAEQQAAQMTGIPPVQQVAVLHPQQAFGPGIPYGYAFQQPGPMALYQQPQPIPDAHLPVLLSETRTYNSEVRMQLAKIMDKMESLGSKIEDSRGGQRMSMPYLESSALLQNIERIVEENTKLKDDVDEKNKKVLNLNEKIGDLLLRNNKFVEESNLLLEKRSNSLHSSTTSSQARLFVLEQEKAKLSTELGEALSTITSLQLDLQKKERALTQQEAAAAGQCREDVESLEKMVSDLEKRANSLQGNLNASRKEKEDLTSTLDELRSELSEVRTSNRNLEQNVMDEQQSVEKTRQEGREQLKAVKENHEKELEALRNELHEQKSREDVTEEKSSLMHRLTLAEEEKRRLLDQVSNLEEEVQSLRLTRDGEKKSSSIWKMKCEKLQDSLSQLKEEYERNRRTNNNNNNNPSQDFEMDLKRAMNGLYRSLQRDIQKDESYSGGDVLKTVLSNIRLVTVAVLEERQSAVVEDEHDTKNEANAVEISTTYECRLMDMPEHSPILDVPKNGSPSVEDEANARESGSSEAPKSTEEKDIVTLAIVDEERNEKPAVSNRADGTEGEPAERNGIEARSETKREETKKDKSEDRNAQTLKSDDKDFADKSGSPTMGTNKVSEEIALESDDDPKKKYLFFDKTSKTWKPQPPPPPLFDDDEDEDDWLK